ncbi:hypothetical protein AALP_AA4G115000 [Arabis alpina]|uniref:Uncharacterized protein n=1 Tax=Arabis alpina TaxID=50452 RepID=A0A087H2M2_ARAAL|nr:hypothetical protein AALP_AA4G115000 [Arabis alpina]
MALATQPKLLPDRDSFGANNFKLNHGFAFGTLS